MLFRGYRNRKDEGSTIQYTYVMLHQLPNLVSAAVSCEVKPAVAGIPLIIFENAIEATGVIEY